MHEIAPCFSEHPEILEFSLASEASAVFATCSCIVLNDLNEYPLTTNHKMISSTLGKD